MADFSTKQGVKKTLMIYERLYERLERLYELNLANPKVLGGVVAVYTRLCAKTSLRNALFKDGSSIHRYLFKITLEKFACDTRIPHKIHPHPQFQHLPPSCVQGFDGNSS